MKILEVKKRELNYNEYKMRSAKESDYETLITESTTILENGKVKVVYLELDMDSTDIQSALNNIDFSTHYRTNGLKTTSEVIGYQPRNVLRRDYCTTTSLAVKNPKEHKIIVGYAEKATEKYREHSPQFYAKHEETMQDKILPEYRMPKSVFTSGIVNKNNPLKYHFDTGNFTEVWSAMFVFKHRVSGGFLALPEYNVGIELKNNSLFLFDGQGILHGVTPIKKHGLEAYRYSIVFYSLKGIWKCQTLTDELIRIRKLKTSREVKRAK